MREVNQNRLLGAFGVALVAIGLLGYTGTLGKVKDQATVIIETNGTITDINASSDSLTRPSTYLYWQDGMVSWEGLSKGTKISADKDVYFATKWKNVSNSTVIGHVDLTVTLPDGSTVSPSADSGQDVSVPSGEGQTVKFRSVQGMQGNYKLNIDITGEYGTTPGGYFTINGQKVTKDATITLNTNDLTFVFHPTQNPSAIKQGGVEVVIQPIKGGGNAHQLNLKKQSDGTYKETDTLSDGRYSITGRFYTDAGNKFTAMSIKDLSVGKEKANKTLWFAPVILGLVAVMGAFSRQYD